MQWRPLILLFCGIAVIYLASLLQETPYPHPYKVYTSDTTRWRHAPNEAILTTAGDYLYLTAIRYKVEPVGFHGLRHGVGELKTGVVGKGDALSLSPSSSSSSIHASILSRSYCSDTSTYQ